MKIYNYKDSRSFRQLLQDVEQANSTHDISRNVAAILEDIRKRGSRALIDYTLKFDGVKLDPGKIRLNPGLMKEAGRKLSPVQRRAIRESIRMVRDYHRPTLPQNWMSRNAHGAKVGERYYPIERAGIYIPGGNVPLVSSVVMTVIPAQVAKVPRIAVFTPPSSSSPGGVPSPLLLGALHLCGVKEVYSLGGIQAIGAAAFGVGDITPVDKLFGPGNAYVNEAKRQVFGRVGVDLQPGPSEVMIIADEGANPGHVAADLLAQAEHGTGKEKIFLVTFSNAMIREVEAEITGQLPCLNHSQAIQKVLDNNYFVIEVEDLEAASAVANAIAPEHLELQVRARAVPQLTRTITTAGAILQGYWTPTVLGDFVAGPSHTLPTGRTSRFFSGLRAVDFMRRSSIIGYSRKTIKAAARTVKVFSELEQLDAHGKSLEIRETQ